MENLLDRFLPITQIHWLKYGWRSWVISIYAHLWHKCGSNIGSLLCTRDFRFRFRAHVISFLLLYVRSSHFVSFIDILDYIFTTLQLNFYYTYLQLMKWKAWPASCCCFLWNLSLRPNECEWSNIWLVNVKLFKLNFSFWPMNADATEPSFSKENWRSQVLNWMNCVERWSQQNLSHIGSRKSRAFYIIIGNLGFPSLTVH